MAKRNTKTTLTVTDFRSWLEGVEDMQGADWSPSLEQWKKIRAKIEMLEEVDLDDIMAVVKTAKPAPAQVGQVSVPSGPIPRAAIPMSQSFLDEVGSTPKLTTVMPSLPNSIVGSPKTPDIDTSTGDYPSAFV